MTQEKLLDKLAKLKRMAEGAAAIGSEAEAQAFADKLQQMLLEHDLQMTDLEFDTMEKDEPVEARLVDYASGGVPFKRARLPWMARLAALIARNNFCDVIYVSGTNQSWLVGRKEHRAVAEYMIVTLTRAVMDISKHEHAKYSWEVYKRDGSTAAARGFKDSFIQGFLVRLFERLEARKKTAQTSTSTALMRINREEKAVQDFMKLKEKPGIGETRNTKMRLAQPSNREGVRRGKEAADKINLDGKAIDDGIRIKNGRLVGGGFK